MDVEKFIRDSAARHLSRNATRLALGMTRWKFQQLLDALPDISWPAPGQSVDALRSFEAREGVETPVQRAALERAWAANKRKHAVTVRGVTGTVPELIKHFKLPIAAETVARRQRRDGVTLEVALFTPPMPRAERNRCEARRKKKAAAPVREPLSTWEAVDLESGAQAPQCM